MTPSPFATTLAPTAFPDASLLCGFRIAPIPREQSQEGPLATSCQTPKQPALAAQPITWLPSSFNSLILRVPAVTGTLRDTEPH